MCIRHNFRLLAIVVAVLFIPNQSISETRAAVARLVERAFNDIGFEHVALQECDIRIGTTIFPTILNNGLSDLRIVLYLDTIQDFASTDLFHRPNTSGPDDFFLQLFLSEDYYARTTDYGDFYQWVRQEFAEENWPTATSFGTSIFLEQIEAELLERVPNLDELNRQVLRATAGQMTYVYPESIDIHSQDGTSLAVLRAKLWEYSSFFKCDETARAQ